MSVVYRSSATDLPWESAVDDDGNLRFMRVDSPGDGHARALLRFWITELHDDQHIVFPAGVGATMAGELLRVGFVMSDAGEMVRKPRNPLDPDLVWIERHFDWHDLPPPGVVQVAFRGGFATARFHDGLRVDAIGCPRLNLDREHWRSDGSCCCPDSEK